MKIIDAEKLKDEIKIKMRKGYISVTHFAEELLDRIASLQREQPEFQPIGYAETYYYQKGLHDGIIKGQMEILKELEEIEKRKSDPILIIKKQEQPDLPGIEESGVPGKDYIPVEWVDACEKYGKWKIVKQEQPEVDLDEEINRFWDSCIKHKNERGANVIWSNKIEIEALARYFYELGLKARK